MKKSASLFCLALATTLSASPLAAQTQPTTTETLRVVKPHINAESENAELCLEFDKSLATTTPSRLASVMQLDIDGKKTTPQNIVATANSLCLFPLERGRSYHLTLSGLRGADGERMTAAYTHDFVIPDRTPMLVFTGKNGGIDGFATYGAPLTLRAVNITRASVEIYRVTATEAMDAAWQDRAQTLLAPSESVYLARTKGQLVKKDELTFTPAHNGAQDMALSLRDRYPDLQPGLYLLLVDTAAHTEQRPVGKGLAPLAAAWFTKSDFVAHAVQDTDGVHVFAASANATKARVRILAFDKTTQQLADLRADDNGMVLIRPNPEKGKGTTESIVAIDDEGNVAFADPEALSASVSQPALGTIRSEALYPAPGEQVTTTLSLAQPDTAPFPSTLRLMRGTTVFADLPVTELTKGVARLTFAAPSQSGTWTLRWQKNDGTVLAETPLRVTSHADAPKLALVVDDTSIATNLETTVDVRSLSSGGKTIPLTLGRVMATWQKNEAIAQNWKDYRFGVTTTLLKAPMPVADFITNEQGEATLNVKLPPPPTEPGLYQAVLTTQTDPDLGIGEAPTLVLPLRGDNAVIGVKPLAQGGRFAQNNLARFSVVALATDGKPRDLTGLSFQIYEEGRSFAWYQHEGRWKYRREPQLRPIGGGMLAVKADGGTVLEWPVTAGNYRLEIQDINGKVLAQSDFSAGWGARVAAELATPLPLVAPATTQTGRETIIRFNLPANAMITATIGDGTLRKTVHELRSKGDNTLSFTPNDDWGSSADIQIRAVTDTGAPLLRGVATIALTRGGHHAQPPGAPAALSPTSAVPPEAAILHSGDSVTLTFDIENRGDSDENARYSFTPSAGIKIEAGSGTLLLAPRSSRSLPVSVRAEQPGGKDIRLDIVGDHAPKLSRSWRVAVLPNFDSFLSTDTVTVAPQANITKPRDAADKTVVFVARRPMDGFGEVLSYVFAANPFSTRELALGIDALRLWDDTIAQTGLAPDFHVAARRATWVAQLLKRQNADGGFGRSRGEASTIRDTATAVTGLALEIAPSVAPARDLAVAWLKQRLANTWFEESEREPRAAIFAALAAAKAPDAASLHYYSDTSVNAHLSPEAQANIAAAFKQIRDPDAAAFWIKKMLGEKPEGYSPALLGALAATDALSSDETRRAVKNMGEAIAAGAAPDFSDAAALLRALAADNVNAGKARIALDKQERGFYDAWAMRASDPAFASLRSADAQPLYVTYAREDRRRAAPKIPGLSVARHVYRTNGVELSPSSRPSRGETYIVELTGSAPALKANEHVLIHDQADAGLRPLSCALSAKLNLLAIIPWFTPKDLTPVAACETTPFSLDAVLSPDTDEGSSFRIVYFAHLEGKAVADFIQPQIRIVDADPK